MQQQRPGVVRYLALKPYGNSLLSPAGAFWIFAVRIAILLMASAEALSWSYAAFYLATGGLRWAAGLGAFVFTFLTVCLIDASLMTLDRWARRHDHRITLETPPKWWERGRDLFSIGTRVGLVALSMYITAPFLTQLMFNDDIERALADERTAIRVKTREALLEPISKRSATLQSQMDDRRAALDAEVAGAGVSGRYGDGVAARQIRASIATLEQEKAAVDAEHKRLSSEFDALNDEQMAERYNVALPGESFQERARALVTIRNDSYRLTERAVQSFLAFLFASLVLLKLFEPRSVQVYFSERLQGLYRQYRGGSFDAHIRRRRADESAALRGLVPEHVSCGSPARSQCGHRRRADSVLRKFRIGVDVDHGVGDGRGEQAHRGAGHARIATPPGGDGAGRLAAAPRRCRWTARRYQESADNARSGTQAARLAYHACHHRQFAVGARVVWCHAGGAKDDGA
jgi:hypothetical protein